MQKLNLPGGARLAIVALFLIGTAIVDCPAAEDSSTNSRPDGSSAWAEIRVVDADTGMGVPLVELETVNGILFVTDNHGRVAIQEPGLIGQLIYLAVHSHGYEAEKDAFGYAGVRITPQPGKPVEIKVKRTMMAERLCRLTGEGLFRDSLLLGYKMPFDTVPPRGQVAGQDSIQAAVYRDKIYCFWGDTQRMEYPLGLFRTAGATLSLRDMTSSQTDLRAGLPYDYSTDPATGFARAMIPMKDNPEGVVWIDGLFVVRDQEHVERLGCHYSRRKGLVEEVEQGIAIFHDERGIFEPAVHLPLDETWRHPTTHPISYVEDGKQWLLFGSPNPNVRVPATLNSILDEKQYEALSCVKPPGGKSPQLELGDEGRPLWRWQKNVGPVESKDERQWVKAGKLPAAEARFLPADAHSPQDRVVLHSGTVRWNEHRKRWILIACQIDGKSSHLGEVWYSESKSPTGPFTSAVKILTHDRQTFYNVCHHTFLDRDNGRTIHFEGTYTNDFSGNSHKTPRYNYNQVLYRLDLDTPELQAARVE